MDNYLDDKLFLTELDQVRNKRIYVKIIVLSKDELPIRDITGRVATGSSLNISGTSNIRRTANITFIADDAENDLTDVDNLLSLNKKVKLQIGVENTIDSRYDNIIWFNEGIFVISNPNLNHSTSGVKISLNLKDKTSLLNGEAGGKLPASVTFSEYLQYYGSKVVSADSQGHPDVAVEDRNEYIVYIIQTSGQPDQYWLWDGYEWQPTTQSTIGTSKKIKQLFYDIIRTSVMNYGGESDSNIVINDVDTELKQIMYWSSSSTLYYNTRTKQFQLNDPPAAELDPPTVWKKFEFRDEIGYTFEDFTYAVTNGSSSEFVTNIGDSVCSVLNNITQQLGNYEYFYDVDGKFIFQEKKNYLNNSYSATNAYRLDNYGRVAQLETNNLVIIDNTNYYVDFTGTGKSIYTFSEGNGLITSYSNTPNYENIKNDFHIWGKNANGLAIHYHLALKKKPQKAEFTTRKIIKLKNEYGDETGKIRLATYDNEPGAVDYFPEDWRAELYLRGLEAQRDQRRPDIYEQELLDLFDNIYNMADKHFKADMINKPNDLLYFFDFLEPVGAMAGISVDAIGPRIHSYQQDSIRRLYNMDVPNIIIVDPTATEAKQQTILRKCNAKGLDPVQVEEDVWNGIRMGSTGYSAEDCVRNLLYQYTNYNESITIQSIPIYYLEPNHIITVYDRKSGISGDYVINSISLPLSPGSTMSISASRALTRV